MKATRHYEVAVRSSAPVAAPQGLCSACGRRPEPGTYFRRRHAPFDEAKAGAALAKCQLPLCDACADALARHERFMMVGAFIGFVLGVAAYAAYWSVNGMGSVPVAIIAVTIDALMAAGAGAMAVVMIGAATRGLWKGSRVARSATVGFEGWRPGSDLEELRARFRFTNEEYARAFAAANAARLLPGRGPNAIVLAAGDETPRRR